MAHTRITDKDARIIAQCARGKYLRNITTQTFIVAADRTADVNPSRKMADVTTLSGDICIKGLLVAPCDIKIESIYVMGDPYPVQAVSGLAWLQFYRTNTLSADMPILSDNSAMGIMIGGNATSGAGLNGALLSTAAYTWTSSKTVIDGTILSGYATVNAGQGIVASITHSGIAVASAAGIILATVEWVPNDKSYTMS